MTNLQIKILIKRATLGISCAAAMVLSTPLQAQEATTQMSLSEAISAGVITNP